MTEIRLQKHLAQLGVGSRRKCEEYIADGLITVNGAVVTEMGVKIDPDKDKVEVDPRLRANEEKMRYIMLNKPAGVVTTCASHVDDETVVDLVDVPERIFPIGRLDKETTGLLILTNDGRITHQLLHPSFEKEKEYEVEVEGTITAGRRDKLEDGVRILGEETKPTTIKLVTKNTMRIIITEGKNRQIRRICRKVGIPVVSLKRIRMNKLWMDSRLEEGDWRDLTEQELKQLLG
ncbi:pseudouridine synthase [Candidatus Peregrinibacteria bacterium CG11_big_fil_rev_8_21_14_0_20_41_10]|nr:MAG: pseudouridine synthase [Candidatus Peregrinibacteria bacterium CG11_big_fil_rev_8_21_14_0_20_41_10]PIZ75762.1 MAG: pseudouridine synthase [Candidatus Peregrinibacteria bacterium CG_4_10_14_0_2_um_filter_41_8]PJC38451.1 MAG: pseudouridine synthase [Candidatus Peregrinibacteria bacterium CG_4_9_14_0_2_um_filter_41_14]